MNAILIINSFGMVSVVVADFMQYLPLGYLGVAIIVGSCLWYCLTEK
jgi:hypothetical protein